MNRILSKFNLNLEQIKIVHYVVRTTNRVWLEFEK